MRKRENILTDSAPRPKPILYAMMHRRFTTLPPGAGAYRIGCILMVWMKNEWM